MAKQAINIGTLANDGTGDPLRTAFDKINDNFTELYGTSADDSIIDDISPQLGGNLDINGFNIVSARTNENIKIIPAGTGTVELEANTNVTGDLSVSGKIFLGNDDADITQVTGKLEVDGLEFNGTTITGLVTNTNITVTPNGTGSIVLSSATTVPSIVVGTATSSISIEDNEIQATVTNSDLVLSASGTGDVVAGAVRIHGTTITSDDSASININEALIVDGTTTVSGAVTMASTLAVTSNITGSGNLAITGTSTLTGTVQIDNLNITDSNITSDTNADISIIPGGTGALVLGALSLSGTTLTATDSSTININEGLVVDGTATVSGAVTVAGTTNTADVVTTGNTTVSGSLTTGTFNVGDLNIEDDGRITTDTNGNVDIDPAGTGAINLTGATNIVGTATVTGQLNVDNLRADANIISATNTNGGIALTPNGTGTVTINGTFVGITNTLSATDIEVSASGSVDTNNLRGITSNSNLTISTQGTGVVSIPSQLTLEGSFLPAIHTFVATDAVTIAEHAGRTLLLGEVGGDAAVTLTLPAATGTGAVYKFIVSVTNTSNYKIQVADATDTIDGIMIYLDEDGTAVTAFPTVAASDTITLNGGTTGGIVGDYLELIDIATNQYHVRGVMRVAAGANPATPFTAAVS
jgi:hypothetical protein